MLDIKFVRENVELVKENIKKKFQDEKLPLVDDVVELDKKIRALKQEAEALRAQRNELSKKIPAGFFRNRRGVLQKELFDRLCNAILVAACGGKVGEGLQLV